MFPAPHSGFLQLAVLQDVLGPLTEVFAVLGVLVIAIIALIIFLFRRGVKKPLYPYESRAVLTPAEQVFHKALMEAVPEDSILLSKVRLADFLEVTREAGEHRLAYFGRISQKHADFLLIDRESALPLLVVELDDSSHKNNQRTRESDVFKNAAFAAAEISIQRFPVQKKYDSSALAISLRQGIEDTRTRARDQRG